MDFLNLPLVYWNEWLKWPLTQLRNMGMDLDEKGSHLIYKIVVTLALLLVLLEILLRIKRTLKWLFRKKEREGAIIVDKLPAKDLGFVESVEAARDLEKTIASLKRGKQYLRMAEIYASLNRHKEAAYWFGKAGERKRSAMEWALAGKTRKAAGLLMSEGDYATAARFYLEIGKPLNAAKALVKAEDHPGAARAFLLGRSPDKAAACYEHYFESAMESATVSVAEECLHFLDKDPGPAKISDETRATLIPSLAQTFERAGHYEQAARLYHESEMPGEAGRCYIALGSLEEAAACLREVGQPQEASRIEARFYETQARWSDAGASYAAAGDYLRAAECCIKAQDPQRAAEYFAKAGEYYGAGLALYQLKRHSDAIPFLQRIRETDKNFTLSRALLGRCFFEMRDYAHCVATLENHLLGRRVESNNMEWFYLLALAYEQQGKLEESKSVLHKIQAVTLNYKDVSQRVSNIMSRISMNAGTSSGSGPKHSALPEQGSERMRLVGELVGSRYRLEREIGRGGMGVVYLAQDQQLDRSVAIKYLGTMTEGSDAFQQRFQREAKAAARVNHPNVTAIYDIGATHGETFIVMEYVDGISLHKYICEKGVVNPREAVNLIVQACGALSAIHEAGIIHRDIKPENFLISKGGMVKLTDFGLAKADDMRLTRGNMVMGTPAYMPPEQAQGNNADARSDLYSLGLVLYEMLVGRPAYTGANLLQRLQSEMPAPPSTYASEVPALLDGIVMKCIAKTPDRRFQSANELANALRGVGL